MRRRPYLEPGTWSGYEIAVASGSCRHSAPFARELFEDIRDFVAEQAEEVEAGDREDVNNALVTLVVCLNSAVEDGLISANPALRVERLPPAPHRARVPPAARDPALPRPCSDVYRPLAELLIGSGLRISEALALRVSDLELDDTGGMIVVYRSRKRGSVGSTSPTDSARSRSDRASASSCATSRAAARARRRPGRRRTRVRHAGAGAKREQGRWESAGVGRPLDRTTVSRDWHKQALQDAALRDMPLHALRHTAAAAWLAAGNSLMYVQRQLGHADISTTERYYGHLERHVLAAGAVATEEAIARAAAMQR